MAVAEAKECNGRRHHAQTFHGAEHLNAHLGIPVVGADPKQLSLRWFVIAPDQHPLGEVAFPAVGAGETLNEIGDSQLFQARNRARLCAFRIHTVNATLVITRADVRTAFQLFGEIFRMFDHQPVNVGNVKRAVGSSPEHGRAEPIVTRGEKFAVLFVGGAMAGEGDSFGFEDFTMHHVLRRFTDEHACGEVRSEECVPIRRGAVGGGQVVGRLRPIESLLRTADRENARRVRIVRQHLLGGRRREFGIARQISLRKNVMP